MSQRVALYRSVVQVVCSMLRYVAVCCCVLQCGVVCCSVLQRLAKALWNESSPRAIWPVGLLQCIAQCCSVLRCVAVYCSMVQYAAVCCNVLQTDGGMSRHLVLFGW